MAARVTKRHLLLMAVGRAVVVTLGLLAFAVISPFGLAQWTDVRSKQVWSRLYAPLYEPLPGSGTVNARDAITVVLLDDAGLAALAPGRAINAFDISEMIDTIAGDKNALPRAIFVDLQVGEGAPYGWTSDKLLDDWDKTITDGCLTGPSNRQVSAFRCLLVRTAELTQYNEWKHDPGCRRDVLAKLDCIAKYHGIPVLFADPLPPGADIGPASNAAMGYAALNRVAITVPVRVDWEKGYQFSAATAWQPNVLTPAAALFALACAQPGCPTPPQRGASWNPAYATPIDVIWAEGQASDFTRMLVDKTGRAPCALGRPGFGATFRRLRTEFLAGFAHDDPPESTATAAVDAPCLYTDTIPYRFFDTLDISPAERRLALGGRIVLLGGALSTVNDSVPAPPYGALPGVYYHAMALDNLIQRGVKYPRMATPIPGLAMTWTDLTNIVIAFGVALAIELALVPIKYSERAAGEQRPWVNWPYRLLLVLGSIVVALLVVTQLSRGQAMIPENFNLAAIAIVVMVGLLEIVFSLFAPLRSLLREYWPWTAYFLGEE